VVIAAALGLAEGAEQRGWEALRAIDWTVQHSRPQHLQTATPEEQDAFKKARGCCRRGRRTLSRRGDRGLRHG
jgi:hypothetical protein